MAWTGPKGAYPSQLHNDGSGWDDCFPDALQGYLRNAGKLSLSDDTLTQLATVAAVVRGTPDSPNNGPVDLPTADGALQHYGLPAKYTTSYQEMINSPWAICLVDGTKLQPANYPSSWFGDPGQANHFVLSLPAWKGNYNWFLDPLNPKRDYCQYDLLSVIAGFYGAYLLPSTGNGETGPQTWMNTRGAPFGLLAQPRHGSTALAIIPAGGSGLVEPGYTSDGAGTNWRAGQWRDKHGWFPNQYVTLSP